jgi:hypothetical protein
VAALVIVAEPHPAPPNMDVTVRIGLYGAMQWQWQ